jgi:hypothetical protein
MQGVNARSGRARAAARDGEGVVWLQQIKAFRVDRPAIR